MHRPCVATGNRHCAGRRRRPGGPFSAPTSPDIWAADFFTVPTLTFGTLFVFFVIGHDRRRIAHWNVTAHPTKDWVWRQIIAPVRSPQANAIAERVIGTIRRECLDHAIVFNERHCRRLLREYIDFYNAARPHQSLNLQPPDRARRSLRLGAECAVGRPVLGGLHHVYEWAA